MVELIGLTNAVTDITIDVTDEELQRIGLQKGFRNDHAQMPYDEFIEFVRGKEKTISPAGSSANVVYTAARLGLETALLGSVGNDAYGSNYLQSLDECGISSYVDVSDGQSGVCYILITPDKERTSLFCSGVSGVFEFELERINDVKLFYTTGYELITNPEKTIEAIRYMTSRGTEIAFDLADPSVINLQRGNLEGILECVDILFSTEYEAEELLQRSFQLEEGLSNICPIVALKKGKNGSVVFSGKERYEIPIHPVNVLNTNGAGDAYAAGFLAGYIGGRPLEECGRMASYVASQVVGIREAHL